MNKSSPFVRISYFNRDEVEKALKDYVPKLCRDHPEIEKVIVFGSFVRDESVPGSDLDLLIILKESELPFLKRIPQFMPSHFPVGIDVFPYTKKEMEKMLNKGNCFLRSALEEGREINITKKK